VGFVRHHGGSPKVTGGPTRGGRKEKAKGTETRVVFKKHVGRGPPKEREKFEIRRRTVPEVLLKKKKLLNLKQKRNSNYGDREG